MRVAVVGCGTAGPAVAVLLARQGHAVEVFERSPDPLPVGAGILLQPTGMAVLHRLGLLEEVRASADAVTRVHGVTRSGRAVMDFDYGDLGPGLHGLGVHRGTLFAALRGALERAGVPVHTGVRITGRDGGRLAGAEDHGRFDLVIAADGARSALRDELGGRVRTYRWGALWAIVEDPDGRHAGALSQTFDGTHRLLGLLPTGPSPLPAGRRRAVSLFWSVRTDRIAALQAEGVEAFKTRVRALTGEAADVLEALTSPEQLLPAVYYDASVRRLHADGLVALGDAAHAMSPQLGQGANLALVDAALLADALAVHLNVDDALAAYARERRAHLRFYAWASRGLNVVFQHDRPRLALPRDHLITPATRIPWFRRAMLETLAGVRTGPVGRLDGDWLSPR